MADVAYIPDSNQANNVLPWMLASQNSGWNNGGFFGGAGGSAFWGGLLGSIIPGVFGAWGNGGFGGFNGGGAGAAASLGAQATANANTELLQNAITGTDADIRLLATTLNTDVDSLKLGINTIQGAIATVGSQVGLSSLQVINAINAGDAALQAKLCECCCENRLAISQQTNTLGSAISASGQRTADAIADLKTSMVSEFCAARERDMQAKIDTQAEIITQLRGQIDNAAQTSAISSYVNSLVAPLSTKVTEIASKMPNTIPVTYPNVVAVNNTPYTGGFGAGYGFGYGVPGGSYWG